VGVCRLETYVGMRSSVLLLLEKTKSVPVLSIRDDLRAAIDNKPANYQISLRKIKASQKKMKEQATGDITIRIANHVS
jgi:hypothetical protein